MGDDRHPAMLGKPGKKGPCQGPLVLAILASFAGVVMLLRPTIRVDQLPHSLIALCSGFIAALAYIQVRQMGVAGEPEYRVVFYFSLVCTVMGLLGHADCAWARDPDIAALTVVSVIH